MTGLKQSSFCKNYEHCSKNLADCAKRGRVETGEGFKTERPTMCEQCIQTMDHTHKKAIIIIFSR